MVAVECDLKGPAWVGDQHGSGPETCRARVLEATEVLERRHSRDVFRLDEIIQQVLELGSPYTVGTIRANILSSMCVEARAGRRTVYADLERVRRGHYRRVRRGD